MSLPTVLTVSASDPTGATGIQSDLAVFAQMGAKSTAVLTALSIQDSSGVREVVRIPADLVRKQLVTLLDDFVPRAVKSGAGLNAETIEILADQIRVHEIKRYVLDASFRTASSFILLGADDVALVKKLLIPLATIVTANPREVEALTGSAMQSEKDMLKAAEEIRGLGAGAVLIWGGVLGGKQAVDFFYDGRNRLFFREALRKGRFQGAGGLFSAAVTVRLAYGDKLQDAVKTAKRLTHQGISKAQVYGKGRKFVELTKAARPRGSSKLL